MDMYPNSEKEVSGAVRILNPVIYLLSVLAGLGVGIMVIRMLQSSEMNGYLRALVSVLAAGVVAAIPIAVYVCVRDLICGKSRNASKSVVKVQQ